MFFTTAGGVVVRISGTPSQAIVAVPSAALTVASFAGTYVGLAFDEGDTSNGSAGSTQPVSVTLAAAGTGTGALITDVNTNALSTTLYFPTNLGIRIDNPAGIGVNRTTRTMSGFATGYVDMFNSSGGFVSANNLFQSSGSSFSVTTNATNSTVSGTINGNVAGVPFVLPIGGSTGDGTSAFIDDKTFAAVEATSGATRNGVAVPAVKMYVVSNDLVATTGFASGVTFCGCASASGYFGFDVPHAGGFDRLHLGQWMSGIFSTNPQIPVSGTATFTGHLLGDVALNSGARYKAAANFAMTYDFSAASGLGQSMSLQVTNFNGSGTLSGTATGVSGNRQQISGSLSGSVPDIGGVSAGLNGNFLTVGSNPVAEVGGTINGSGTGGSFTSVFVARQ